MYPMFRIFVGAAVLLMIGFSLVGCGQHGPKLAPVTGKVIFGGEPVTEGTVLFQPDSGPGASSRLDSEGRYTLATKPYGNGAVVGKGVFAIVPPTDMPPLGPQSTPNTIQPRKTVFPNIPEKFRNPTSSGLLREINSGSNVFDFELKE